MNCLSPNARSSYRTTDAQCISLPLFCMWTEMPEIPVSGCWKATSWLEMLVRSEQVAVEATYSTVPDWLSNSDMLFLWCKGVELEVLLGSGCWSFFVLRKRPPDPLILFNAWICRDSWRYGCIYFKVDKATMIKE